MILTNPKVVKSVIARSKLGKEQDGDNGNMAMTIGSIICFIFYIMVALFMMVIGVSQIKSQNPVGFYSGEKPSRPDELTDVILWNKKTWNYVGSIRNYYYGFLFYWFNCRRFHLEYNTYVWCYVPGAKYYYFHRRGRSNLLGTKINFAYCKSK